MKKLMRKLVLSSFALGLAVITLSTTTFAWYTSNTDVKAQDINGTTASSGVELLMISQDKTTEDGSKKQWYTTIEHVAQEALGDLTPLQYNQKGGMGTIAGGATVAAPTTVDDFKFYPLGDGDESASGTGFVQFTLYFKNASTSNVDLYISNMTFTNTTNKGTTLLPKKDIIAAGAGALTGLASGVTTYSVDVLRTLMVATTVYTWTDGAKSAATEAIYDPEGIMPGFKDLKVNNGNLTDDAYVDTWNAHSYYNLIMEDDEQVHTYTNNEYQYGAKSISTSGTVGNELLVVNVPGAGTTATANRYVEVTFRIFINGWDAACFDACQEQTFTLELGFTTEAKDALFVA